jgi:hypothetical protein
MYYRLLLPLVLGLGFTTSVLAEVNFRWPPPPPTVLGPPGPTDFNWPATTADGRQLPRVGPDGLPLLLPTNPPPGMITVYRLYGFQAGAPLFTEDFNEVVTLVQRRTHRFEGAPFFLSAQEGPQIVPLVRMVRPSGSHFLSTNPNQDPRGRPEKEMGGIRTRGGPGLTALFEWWHPQKDLFLYTTDPRGEIAPNVGYQGGRAIGFVVPAQ